MYSFGHVQSQNWQLQQMEEKFCGLIASSPTNLVQQVKTSQRGYNYVVQERQDHFDISEGLTHTNTGTTK